MMNKENNNQSKIQKEMIDLRKKKGERKVKYVNSLNPHEEVSRWEGDRYKKT